MKIVIRKMGNSQGVIIPKPLLAEIGAAANDHVDIKVENGRIVIALLNCDPRAGWAEDSKRLAEGGEGGLVWPEFPNKGDENLEW
jgi:antitoxin MazE